jgi:hypothetical protein
VRVLLIRRTDRRTEGAVTVFAVRSGVGERWIERARLDRIDEVLDLDIPALGRGARLGFEPREGPLFVVCTHGRRDPCCAERGRPVARALAGAFPDETWESSHVGGDRFAGNLVAFPHGLYFGRLGPETAPSAGRAYADGRIDLVHHRGRSCFAMDVQAAEHFLRVERHIDGVDAIRFERVRRAGTRTMTTFAVDDGRSDVTIERGGASPRRLTCHAEHDESPPSYRLVAIATP